MNYLNNYRLIKEFKYSNVTVCMSPHIRVCISPLAPTVSTISTANHIFFKPAWCEEGFSICLRLHILQTIYFLYQHNARKVLVYVPNCIPYKPYIFYTSIIVREMNRWTNSAERGECASKSDITLPCIESFWMELTSGRDELTSGRAELMSGRAELTS